MLDRQARSNKFNPLNPRQAHYDQNKHVLTNPGVFARAKASVSKRSQAKAHYDQNKHVLTKPKGVC